MLFRSQRSHSPRQTSLLLLSSSTAAENDISQYNTRQTTTSAGCSGGVPLFTSHTERSCTTSAAFPTEHQPPVDANSSSKSKVANTITTLFGPSSTLPTFFSHERDSVLHLDLSARRRPVQLLIETFVPYIIRYGTFTFQPRRLTRWGISSKTQVGATVLYFIL